MLLERLGLQEPLEGVGGTTYALNRAFNQMGSDSGATR